MTNAAAHRYLPLVRWSDEDKCYVGSCPPIIGECCHGDEPAKVMRALTIIMDEHLAYMDEDKVAYPAATNKNYTGKLPLRINPDLHRAVAVRAAASGDSINGFIERMLAASVSKAFRPAFRQTRRPAHR